VDEPPRPGCPFVLLAARRWVKAMAPASAFDPVQCHWIDEDFAEGAVWLDSGAARGGGKRYSPGARQSPGLAPGGPTSWCRLQRAS
jgi:hypothetical protein